MIICAVVFMIGLPIVCYFANYLYKPGTKQAEKAQKRIENYKAVAPEVKGLTGRAAIKICLFGAGLVYGLCKWAKRNG